MKFGRKPRIHNPAVPNWSTLVANKTLAAPPIALDYMKNLPATGLGMFDNDELGDCTCAAVYHALQIWTSFANPPTDTEAAVDAVLLYELACGYIPGDPNTDQGGIVQNVLGYWLQPGIPTGPVGGQKQLLSAFVEIDQRDIANVKVAIQQGGLVYIGFLVPGCFNVNAPIWDVNPHGDNNIIAGHAVVIGGYNDTTKLFDLISWGQKYHMSYAFFEKFVDEAYLLANKDWIEKTGLTPAGLSLTDLETLMQGLKWGGGAHRSVRRKHRRWKKQRGIKPPKV